MSCSLFLCVNDFTFLDLFTEQEDFFIAGATAPVFIHAANL